MVATADLRRDLFRFLGAAAAASAATFIICVYEGERPNPFLYFTATFFACATGMLIYEWLCSAFLHR